MKKVLFTATVDEHILHFHLPYLKWFREQGFEVHVASWGEKEIPYADKKYNVPFSRSPWSLKNIEAYRRLKKIITANSYRIIHCHTPVGGVLTRLVAREARKNGTKVIYTAHGFHFYKGAPLKNWLLYYPVEKLLARQTDCLITINEEDYRLALDKKFKALQIKKVDGVGVDLTRFSPRTEEDKKILRREYGYKEEDFILICVGELNDNKNQDLIIKALAVIKNNIPEIKLLLAGKGEKETAYRKKAKELAVDDYIDFLGYRNDIPNLLKIADLAVSTSRREGLPVNIMEAMAAGLPLVVTDCRGNRDLVEDGVNGLVVRLDDEKDMAEAVLKVYQSHELRQRFSENSLKKIKKYSLDVVGEEMAKVYVEMNL